MTSRRLAILGASGHGSVVADAADLVGWAEITFYDDAWPGRATNGDWSVVGDSASLMEACLTFDGVIVAIGDNRVRLAWTGRLAQHGAKIATIIHPAAVVSSRAKIGYGTVICAGAVVNPFARIGVASIVNTAATIDHDCILADGVHVSPGANLAGSVSIGECTWVGIGACVKQTVLIGAHVMVGAGAVVIRNVADGLTIAGVPAAPI